MRELSEVTCLLQYLNLIMKGDPLNYNPKDPPLVKFGFITDIFILVSLIEGMYQKAEKDGDTEVIGLGLKLDERMGQVDMAGTFLSRCGDHDGAQFCFAMKNVYQWVLEKPDSSWSKFPTRRDQSGK